MLSLLQGGEGLLEVDAVVVDHEFNQFTQAGGAKDGVAGGALPVCGRKGRESFDQLLPRGNKIVKRGSRVLEVILAFPGPLIGGLGGDKGIFLSQDAFKPKQVDFAIHIPQMAEHFKQGPFFGLRAPGPLIG